MKKLKTFEQYNNSEPLNEGLMDIYQKYAGKLKSIISKLLHNLSPEKMNKLKEELQEYAGMNLAEIKTVIAQRANTVNEGKVSDFIGLLTLGGVLGSIITLTINHWGWISLSDVGVVKTAGVLAASIIIFLLTQAVTNDDIG